MKKWVKIILIGVVVLLIIVSAFIFFRDTSSMCGTAFYVRSETGQCEIHVGCSLPSGMQEDFSCREVMRQQIDGSG